MGGTAALVDIGPIRLVVEEHTVRAQGGDVYKRQDPGYAIVGWGCVRYERARFTPLDFGAVTTPAGMDFSERLERIYDELALLLAQKRPDAMAVEKLYFKNNQKTAIDVAQARGMVLLAARTAGVPLYEYTPLQMCIRDRDNPAV